MADEPEVGVQRVTVRGDGTREVELVGPDHPVIGPLASLVESELRSHIAGETLGVAPDRFELWDLPNRAFSIAEEVDYYFALTERPTGDIGTPGDRVGVEHPEGATMAVADTVNDQFQTDLIVGAYGPEWDEVDQEGVHRVADAIAAEIERRYVAVPRADRLVRAEPVPALLQGVFVLGVRRSGTTLLRVMLDRHPELAVPDESYFIPQLARRHRDPVDVAAFVDDLGRLSTLAEWGLDPLSVAARLEPGLHPGQAIAAIFEAYAEDRGKSSWGDKTPLYMQSLPTLERLFPLTLYVHLVRDGRDAALSFLSVPPGIMTESWGHPRDSAGFACQWATEVRDARALGRRVGQTRYLEVRYEALVADPEAELRRVCAFLALEYDEAMVDYAGKTDSARKEHQQRLNEPPRVGVRNWRTEMTPSDVDAFEAVAGDLLHELGYEVTARGHDSRRLAAYRAKTAAWRAVGAVTQRSPLWRRRHARLR
ncbi:MAG TPA: sulfotransferase [Gaiella sp.]